MPLHEMTDDGATRAGDGLLATHGLAMPHKNVLGHILGQYVRRLQIS